MTVLVRGSSFGDNPNTTVLTIDKPVGTVDGDFMVMTYLVDGAIGTPTFPAGWLQLYTDVRQADFRVWCLYKVADSEPTNYTLTGTSTVSAGYDKCTIDSFYDDGGLASWTVSGFDLEYNAVIGADTTVTHTTIDNCVLLMQLYYDEFGLASALETPPNGMTEIQRAITDQSHIWTYREDITTGKLESKTFLFSDKENIGALFHIQSSFQAGGGGGGGSASSINSLVQDTVSTIVKNIVRD